MTLNDVLLSLLDAMDATGETHLVGWDTVQQWPDSTLDRLREAGILTTAKPTLSVECRECENRCFMDVLQLSGGDNKPARSFVVCGDPEKQGQMGRIEIPMEHLQQWKVTTLQLAKVIAGLVGIECKAEDRHGQANIRVGMIKGKNGRRWLSLNKSPLVLEINDYYLPLEEILFFEDGALAIDQMRIDQLIDKTPGGGGEKYKPSTEKREAGKRKTEAMYEDWREAYRQLRRKHTNKSIYSDSRIARQISKMDIAQQRDPETIRKKMKG